MKYELEVEQISVSKKHQAARLQALLDHKEGGDQGEVIHVFEEQIATCEMQSKMLITEIRRLAKVQANEIQMGQEKGNYEVLNERIIKNLKLSVASMSKQLDKQTEELQSMRKRERLYELQKRCLEDSNRKANLYAAKVTLLSEKLSQSQSINQSIDTDK